MLFRAFITSVNFLICSSFSTALVVLWPASIGLKIGEAEAILSSEEKKHLRKYFVQKDMEHNSKGYYQYM